MLTLYHHGSSACAAKVRLALAEKKLPWTGCYVDILRGEQFLPEFRALNPQAVVPPGAAEKLQLYSSYLQKMEAALSGSDWLVGNQLTMADIAMAPYVKRLAALALERLSEGSRLPRVASWFERMRARETFKTALIDWMPADLAAEMRANGARSREEIERLIMGHER
jgi:glutathione S-transferase